MSRPRSACESPPEGRADHVSSPGVHARRSRGLRRPSPAPAGPASPPPCARGGRARRGPPACRARASGRPGSSPDRGAGARGPRGGRTPGRPVGSGSASRRSSRSACPRTGRAAGAPARCGLRPRSSAPRGPVDPRDRCEKDEPERIRNCLGKRRLEIMDRSGPVAEHGDHDARAARRPHGGWKPCTRAWSRGGALRRRDPRGRGGGRPGAGPSARPRRPSADGAGRSGRADPGPRRSRARGAGEADPRGARAGGAPRRRWRGGVPLRGPRGTRRRGIGRLPAFEDRLLDERTGLRAQAPLDRGSGARSRRSRPRCGGRARDRPPHPADRRLVRTGPRGDLRCRWLRPDRPYRSAPRRAACPRERREVVLGAEHPTPGSPASPRPCKQLRDAAIAAPAESASSSDGWFGEGVVGSPPAPLRIGPDARLHVPRRARSGRNTAAFRGRLRAVETGDESPRRSSAPLGRSLTSRSARGAGGHAAGAASRALVRTTLFSAFTEALLEALDDGLRAQGRWGAPAWSSERPHRLTRGSDSRSSWRARSGSRRARPSSSSASGPASGRSCSRTWSREWPSRDASERRACSRCSAQVRRSERHVGGKDDPYGNPTTGGEGDPLSLRPKSEPEPSPRPVETSSAPRGAWRCSRSWSLPRRQRLPFRAPGQSSGSGRA